LTAPGDNGPCGTPASYVTKANGKKIALGLKPAEGGSQFSAEVTLPAGSTRFSIQAIDAAGNIGPQVTVPVP
jgi:hypothetical protein